MCRNLVASSSLTLSRIRGRRGALLFTQIRESAAKLIAADQFVFFVLLCLFLFCRSVLVKFSFFVVLYLKQNKRATWRSLARAKGRNLR